MDLKALYTDDKLIRYAVIVLSVLGIIVSIIIKVYLETDQTLPGCKIGSVVNCTDVINGPYGKVFGIPLSYFGAFYFLVFLALYAVDFNDDYIVAIWSTIGLLAVINFVALELFVINHICLYCTSVHVLVVLVFLLVGPRSIWHSYLKLKERFL